MKKRICIVVSSMYTAQVFLLDQLAALSRFYEVTLIANTQDKDFLKRQGINVAIIPAPLERKINIIRDIKALFALYRLFARNQYVLVHSITPKAGLLSMIAGVMARVPNRIHTFTGQIWPTQTGIMYHILKWADKLISILSTDILVDSASQRDFLLSEHVVNPDKAAVLAHGSISGVNTERFKPNPGYRRQIRSQEGIPQDSLLFLYMARLTKDKGALIMAHAISVFTRAQSNAHYLVIGPDEENLRSMIRVICSECLDKIHFVDFTSIPEQYMAAADVFCLPSFREGFGTVLINAGATGIPAIAARIYGSVDAVVDEVTGLLFEAGNIQDFVSKMNQLASDPKLRNKMGEEGRMRAERYFSEGILTSSLLNFYNTRLSK